MGRTVLPPPRGTAWVILTGATLTCSRLAGGHRRLKLQRNRKKKEGYLRVPYVTGKKSGAQATVAGTTSTTPRVFA
ncbi:hypothetical protein PoB_000470500 [Plakobranchus ocellatus]|uniref:Secreted protein n=1 Tax=Plakobranchus ocellatus TaxID=259542 RepID=A0AAV3Y545_9GAST|nr:hypothetical protein PoB_000470500 [Plakobranchus ocellatus]